MSAISLDRRKRLGKETPRVFTPPLRELTPDTSLGFHVIRFAESVLMIELHPWQKWLLVHALELLPDNTLRFRTVVVLVARQNGKSLVSQVLALWMMYVYGLGLVLGTAQDLDTAEEVWQGAVDLVTELDDDTDEPLRPDLYDLLDRVVQVNGKKALVLKNKRRYKVKAANRRAGRGLSGDLILLDELREHQSWDAWGSITKTTMARAMALILCLSNAGDATSIVLRYLRKMGHAEAGDPDGLNAEERESIPDDDLDEFTEDAEDLLEGDTLGLFEWSAVPGCSIDDRDQWAQANPSMNHPNGIAERTIAAACKTDPEFVFRPEVLCQWLDSSGDGIFPPGSWEAGIDGESRRSSGAEVKASVEMSHDRAWVHVSVAARRDDGKVHVERVASRAGSEWVVPWFTDPDKPHRKAWQVAVQGRGAPASSLIDDLEAAGVEVVRWEGSELATAHGRFYDLVRGSGEEGKNAPGVYHRPDSRLDIPAATAVTKPLGDGWVIDRKRSPEDPTPLVGAIAATWLLMKPKEEPVMSAYETAGVSTV